MTPSIPLAWLGTYLVHSTLLLGLAWLASRLLRRRSSDASLALEEGLWKTALVGGILTATLQVGLGLLAPAPQVAEPFGMEAVAASAQTALPTAGTLATGASPATPHPLLARPAALLPGWQRLALGVWMLGALLGLALLGASWLRFGRAVRARREVTDGAPRRLLDRLLAACSARRPVRLTGAERLPVPVAIGVVGREICVPHRVLDRFGPRRQEALLAHELAHLERRDPIWLLTGQVIGGIFFFQPLNRLARLRLLEIAEYRCDAWAVERTGDRVGLARCLTEVAGWLTGGELAPAPGMASRRTALGRRVRRILEGSRPESDGRSRRWALPLAAGLLVAVGCLAPGVAPALPDDPATAEGIASTVSDAAEPRSPSGQDDRPAADEPEAERAAAQAGERDRDRDRDRETEWIGDSESEWHPNPDPSLDPALRAEIAEIERLAAEIALRAVPDPEALEALSAEAARIAERSARIDEEAMAVLEARMEELGVERFDELEPAERERIEAELQRLGEEVRRAAEHARPTEEELARLQELAERAKPDDAELERMQRELERMSREVERQVREEHRRVLEERRQELEVHREQIERMNAEVAAENEKIREMNAELAAEAGELERERMERHRGELESRRQVLEERMHELEARQGQELAERRQVLEERRRDLEERAHALDEARAEIHEEQRAEAEEQAAEAAEEPPGR